MNTLFTAVELLEMNATDLRKAGTQLGVKNSKTFKKAELLKLCIDTVNVLDRRKDEEDVAVEVVEISEDIKETVETDQDTETSETPTEDWDKLSLPEVAKSFDLEMAQISFPEISAIFHSKIFETKSDKFRALHKEGKGLRIADIAKLFNAHYSYVFGVIARSRKRI